MFLYNYNGGPEIVLNENDDIYKSAINVSEYNTLPYNVIKEILNQNQIDTGRSLCNDKGTESIISMEIKKN